MAAQRLLVVDDEQALASIVASYLSRAGFVTRVVHTGPEAVDEAREGDPDVIVLDLGLPGLDGIEVCRQIRAFSDCCILMLTARGDETDRIVGLSVGADDYLVKPFSNRELVARVQTVLRRPRRPSADPAQQVMRFGALTIDVGAHEVAVDGRLVALTRTEFDILQAVAAHPGLVLSRRQIIDDVWGGDWYGDDHVERTAARLVNRCGSPNRPAMTPAMTGPTPGAERMMPVGSASAYRFAIRSSRSAIWAVRTWAWWPRRQCRRPVRRSPCRRRPTTSGSGGRP